MILLGGALSAETSPRWRWSSPLPHGNNIYDAATSFGLTLHVTERGQIYSSDDLVAWDVQDSKTTNALRAVTFFGSRIIVTGEQGTVLHAESLADFQPAILNPATTDWLEGVAASPFLAVAVGDNGAIYTSSTATNWVRQTAGTTQWLRSVAFGTPGNSVVRFVAVGERGTLLTSGSNGATWQPRSSNTTNDLNRVAFFNQRFWAVGNNGTIRHSADGITWLSENSGATNTLNGIAAFSIGPATNVVVAGDGEVRAGMGGAPPLTWSNQLDPALSNRPPNWTYNHALSLGSFVLLSGRTGMVVEGYRVPDGFYWTTPETYRNWLWDITAAPGFYVTVGDFGTVMTSNNGVDWSLELSPASVATNVLLGVGGGTNGLVAAASQGRIIFSPNTLTNIVVTNGTTMTTNTVSTLGAVWNAVASPTTNDLQGVAWFNSLHLLSGATGTILTSPDGTNWTTRATPTTQFLSSVAASPTLAVAAGNKGVVLTSPNGTAWTAQTSGTTNWLFKVRYLDGMFLAVGQNGTILASPNGTAWTMRTSGVSGWLNDVTLIAEAAPPAYYIVGNQGVVLTSTNAVDWSRLATTTGKSLYGAAHRETQLMAVGYEGAILRSPTVPIMDPINIVSYSRAFGQNVFLVAGKPDQRFTMDRGTNLLEWTAGPRFEILSGSGTLLFAEPVLTNAPPAEFYRGTTVE